METPERFDSDAAAGVATLISVAIVLAIMVAAAYCVGTRASLPAFGAAGGSAADGGIAGTDARVPARPRRMLTVTVDQDRRSRGEFTVRVNGYVYEFRVSDDGEDIVMKNDPEHVDTEFAKAAIREALRRNRK